MDDALRRRLTILVIVLVAVTILSKVGVPSLTSWSPALFSTLGLNPSMGWETMALLVSIWVVLITMLAMIPLRLLLPHPPGVRLWRQPGWLACNAVALTFAIGTIRQFGWIGIGFARQATGLGFIEHFRMYLLSFAHQITSEALIAIAAGWATLALTGCWEPSEGWLDRLGRLCGIYVLAFPIVAWIVALLGWAWDSALL
jgi:hypothetical protein